MRRTVNGKTPVIAETAVVLDGARISGDVQIGERTSVWYNAVIRGDLAPIRVGRESNVQDCVVIHADEGGQVLVGHRVTIGHGAVLHGCILKDDAVVGMNTVIMDGAVVEEGAIVGANSFVKRGQQIPPFVLAAGSPAQIIRPLTEEEKEHNLQNCGIYLKLGKLYGSAE